MARSREPTIGACWSEIWNTDVWTLYVWQEPAFRVLTATAAKSANWASLVKMHDKTVTDPNVVYEFGHGRNFYDRPPRRRR